MDFLQVGDMDWLFFVGLCLGGLASWLMFRNNITDLKERLEQERRKQSQ